MQVSIETTSGLERKMTLGIPAERIDAEVNERLNKASKTVRLDGFRKGKVPMNVLKKRFGESIRQEVVGEVLGRTFTEAVAQEKLKPAGRPEIESVKNEPGQDLEFVATFEVMPEVVLTDLTKVVVTKPLAKVTEEDVTAMIDALRKQNASWEEVNRPAVNGDEVNIDYNGLMDGEEFDGGSAKEFMLDLGASKAIPGFEEGVVGMSAGEEKVLSLTFPDNYHAEELKGKPVEFTIKVNAVTEAVMPPLDEAFFALYGMEQGTEERFREVVRLNMERDLKQALKTKTTGRVMEQLCNLHNEQEIPEVLVASEITKMKKQMADRMGGGSSNFDPELLPDDLFIDQAKRRSIVSLIINEIVNTEKIETSPEKVRDRVEEMAYTYEKPEEVVKYYYSSQELMKGVESAVLQDQVIDHVLSVATVNEEEVSYQKAIQPDQDGTADF